VVAWRWQSTASHHGCYPMVVVFMLLLLRRFHIHPVQPSSLSSSAISSLAVARSKTTSTAGLTGTGVGAGRGSIRPTKRSPFMRKMLHDVLWSQLILKLHFLHLHTLGAFLAKDSSTQRHWVHVIEVSCSMHSLTRTPSSSALCLSRCRNWKCDQCTSWRVDNLARWEKIRTGFYLGWAPKPVSP